MMSSGNVTAFLRQAHWNNWQQYLASLQLTDRTGWDVCVLTAGDEGQAALYRRQLEWRSEAGLLPRNTRFLVASDPEGCRIGSGGATLWVLAQLGSSAGPFSDIQIQEDILTTGKVLIIHSGGDSRRLPHCSASGKLFARVPRILPDGRASRIR